MSFIKKTKIVATLGPSSSKSKIIKKMILEGVNVFRFNFSHEEYEVVKEKIKIIRSIDQKLKTSSSILGDLQGPKIRLGKIEEKCEILSGEEYEFFTDKEFIGNKNKGYINYNEFAKDLSKGEDILIDDGKLIFKVISSDKKSSEPNNPICPLSLSWCETFTCRMIVSVPSNNCRRFDVSLSSVPALTKFSNCRLLIILLSSLVTKFWRLLNGP